MVNFMLLLKWLKYIVLVYFEYCNYLPRNEITRVTRIAEAFHVSSHVSQFPIGGPFHPSRHPSRLYPWSVTTNCQSKILDPNLENPPKQRQNGKHYLNRFFFVDESWGWEWVKDERPSPVFKRKMRKGSLACSLPSFNHQARIVGWKLLWVFSM